MENTMTMWTTDSGQKGSITFGALTAGIITTMAAAAIGFAPTAAAGPPVVSNCGANAFVSSISTEPIAGPDYIIHLKPTYLGRQSNVRVVNDMWHQIQACVPGLYDDLADSIYQQLECHQMVPHEAATGATYDLETWREKLPGPNPVSYGVTHCLNQNADGSPNGSPGAGNNFPGYLDTVDHNDNIG